jgi:hypothetical protein
MRTLALLVLLGAMLTPPALAAAPAPPPPRFTTALFSISKSENKNQVQYAIRLDDNCAPWDDTPVFAFWRMLEKDAQATEPLLPREEQAYGIASQTVVARGPSGGKVRLVLRALPNRPIEIQTVRHDGACIALSTVPIGGAPAHLYNVHARLKWPFGVDYLLLSGWSMDGTRVLKEELKG